MPSPAALSLSTTGSLKGRFLVAVPSLGDSRFQRAVILVCDHTPEYAMGLVVNDPMPGLTVGRVLAQLSLQPEAPDADRLTDTVMDGGPVGEDKGFVLHSPDFEPGEASQEITPGIWLTATRDILLAMSGDMPPARSVLMLGYAGWGAGQLEAEMRDNAWLVVPADEDIVFSERHTNKWSAALGLIGIDGGRLSGPAGTA